MTLYTIGFTQKSAERFFGLIKENEVQILVDIRLNNKSQLAGFTKGDDLRYFLKEICQCGYAHCDEYAPTKEILDDYKKKRIPWEGYVEQYLPLMERRGAAEKFLARFGTYERVCLLCSEPTPEQCHRRLLAELIQARDPGVKVRHL